MSKYVGHVSVLDFLESETDWSMIRFFSHSDVISFQIFVLIVFSLSAIDIVFRIFFTLFPVNLYLIVWKLSIRLWKHLICLNILKYRK